MDEIIAVSDLGKIPKYEEFIKALIMGAPKEAGKTTLALRATPTGRNLVLNYDIGNVLPPPEVDKAKLFARNYPAPQYKGKLGQFISRPTAVGDLIWDDAVEINDAFHTKRDIKLLNPDDPAKDIILPLPDTIIMDGLVALDAHIVNAILGHANCAEVDDYRDAFGKLNPQKFWNQRLFTMTAIYDMLMPLPCNVIAITWESKEMAQKLKDGKVMVEFTGRMQPDCGGKLDIQMPGKVDASIYCYFNQAMQKYFVQTNSSTTVKSTSVRGKYSTSSPKTVDVTIGTGVKNPWKEILGR